MGRITRAVMQLVMGAIASWQAVPAFAAPLECTVILDRETGDVLHRKGTCDRRFSPASTFKVPLAVMGYEAGILKDASNPAWKWKPEFQAPERDRKTVNPTTWERDSVLWYSREITRLMGGKAFASAVRRLDYGNQDVSGARGRNDGLTHSWIGSSLTISPDEQARFIRRLLSDDLPVSGSAMAATRAIVPAFSAADGRTVYGKTGTTWLTGKTGEYDRNRPVGWFIGWSSDNGRDIVFARMRIGDRPSKTFAGPKLRDEFLRDLPAILKQP